MICAVIGSSYGDEGKGKITNIISKLKGTKLNILFNGGCQRLHTVKEGNIEHYFRHFGSGTFNNADTYFTEDFLIEPVTFLLEYDTIKEKYSNIYSRNIYCDKYSRIITPFDAICNQIQEVNRGKEKHGSCGFGIYNTINRNENGVTFVYDDIINNNIENKLKEIRKYYLDNYDFCKQESLYYNENVIKNLIASYNEFKNIVQLKTFEDIYYSYEHIIFEGGQGLRLSQTNIAESPHLTPSNTGLDNINKLFEKHNINDKITVFYVSRVYLTRHGAGNFKSYDFGYPIIDTTNLENKFQGSIRFGLLNIDDLVKYIKDDIYKNSKIITKTYLIFNCMDQIKNEFLLESDNQILKYPTFNNFMDKIKDEFNQKNIDMCCMPYDELLVKVLNKNEFR